MIWATTQQYANAAHEMATLNEGRPLDDTSFKRANRGDRDHPARSRSGLGQAEVKTHWKFERSPAQRFIKLGSFCQNVFAGDWCWPQAAWRP
jgi:hypothetical protein